MGRRVHRSRNDSGSLLAATFVVGLAVGCTVFAVFAIVPQGSVWKVAVAGAGFAAFLVAIAMLRFGRLPMIGLDFWSTRFRSHRGDSAVGDYLPRARRQKHQPLGTNEPITADQARELNQSSSSTWVPSGRTRD